MPGNPCVIFKKPREVVVEDHAKPVPGPGEVLIRSLKTLISTGTELTILGGRFPEKSAWANYGKFPFVPGYDCVGMVEAAGEGVDASIVGKMVECSTPHSMYGITPVDGTHEIPDGVSAEEAVFGTIAQIVFNGVRRGNPRWGESAVVFGCGLLGQVAVQALSFAGCLPVAAVDPAEWRLGLLPRRSNVAAINPERGNVKDRVGELTGGRMADMVFEVTGMPSLIPSEFEVLRWGGRMVVLSSPWGKTEFDFHDLCNAPSFTIIGAHNSSHPACESYDNPWTKRRHLELFFDMIKTKQVDVKPLVSHRAAYTKAPDLYRRLLEDRSTAMGVIIEWDKA